MHIVSYSPFPRSYVSQAIFMVSVNPPYDGTIVSGGFRSGVGIHHEIFESHTRRWSLHALHLARLTLEH